MPKSDRFEMVLPPWLKAAVKECADLKGVGMSEYVKDVLKEAVKRDLEGKEKNNE